MELLIESPQVPQVTWNYAAIKEAALAKAKEYTGIIYEDADEAAMKRDKADINRIINAIEDERKRIKKQCMAPYDAFEGQVKDVLSPLRDAVAQIEKGLTEIDRKWRAKRKEFLQGVYADAYSGITEAIPFEKTVREEYFKKAYTDKKLEKAYRDIAAQAQQDIESIMGLDAKYQAPAISAYLPTFSLSDAQAEAFRLQKLDEAMEQRRRAEEERKKEMAAIREKAAREAEERKARKEMEEASQKDAQTGQEEVRPEVPHEVVAQEAAGREEAVPIQRATDDDSGPKMSFGPAVFFGTKAQLMGLAQYIREHGIECRRA